MNNLHFAIPEIYGETLSYYELLRNLVNKVNDLIDNYNTVPDQIAEEVKNLDASQLFSAVLNQLIHSIATDNTKSANAVKVYKKHDLLYATFNETVNLYESLIDFKAGTETELIIGTNIREVNISELFIELRKLIDINKNNIEAVTAVSNENSAEITTIQSDITSIENKNTEQDNELSTLRTMISSPYNFKGDVASISALPETGNVNDTYYVQDVKYKVTWTGSAWVQSSLSEADYQTELSELKGDLGDISIITLSTVGYIATNTSVINLTPVSNNSYRCAVLDCVEGDLFTVTSTSGEGSLPYVFIDADNNALQKCKASSVTNLFIRAPKNTSKVVFNTGSIPNVKIYHGWKSIIKSLSYLDSNLLELSQIVNADKENAELEKLIHVKNDLLTDGITGMPNCIISLNGDVSDAHYGKDGAVYTFRVPKFKKTYVAFDFKWLNVLPYVSDDDKYPFAEVYGALNQPCIYPRNSVCDNGTMYRVTLYGSINSYMANYSKVFGWNQFKTNNGKNALWVEYTGERIGSDDDAEIQFTANSVILKRNGTSFATLEYSVNDSVQSLIDALNSVENINAKAINAAGHTIAELLPVVLNGCFSFGCSYTNSSGTKIYDFCKVNIPYALDDEWHTCEVAFDPSTNTSYVSIDGNTLKTNVSSTRYVDAYKYISVGATDIKVKNLIIDYGSFGDAEVVTSVAYPTEGIPQLVSNRSPRVIVFEGHGVEAVSDDTELSDDMNCTTDRLLSLFEKLNNAGYKPITWEQYKAWKINGVGNLPKRSYLMMFDDYRYENYMIIANRIPFTKFDVKPALAVITGLKNPTENITVDGKTYSVRDIWDLIVKAGWHPCSHTCNHRIISKYSPSELDTLFKVDVQSCDNIGIYSDIIVYPTGAIDKCDYAALERSNFALGVNIVTQNYNCKATNNYYISRVDIGSRNTIEQLYSAIV